MEVYEDLIAEISAYRDGKNSGYIENLIEEIICNGNYGGSTGRKYHCTITHDREKHNELQYTEYYCISSDIISTALHLEIENGISNGTQLRAYSFYSSLAPTSRTIEVLSDVVIDKSRYEGDTMLDRAELMLLRHKEDIMRLVGNMMYDNYVTGGGTVSTSDYYSNKFSKYADMGLFWVGVYDEIEVDVNLINKS